MPPLPSPPPSAYPGNPFPSSSQLSGKSMNTEGHLWRQVRISLSKPHNAIKPTTNQSTHGWLACAYTPLIPDDLRLHHICGRCFPEFMFLFFICFLINISCNYFILKYCNFIFFFPLQIRLFVSYWPCSHLTSKMCLNTRTITTKTHGSEFLNHISWWPEHNNISNNNQPPCCMYYEYHLESISLRSELQPD